MSRGAITGLIWSLASLVGACGSPDTDPASDDRDKVAPLTAATLGEQIALDPEDYLAQEPYASADPRRGEALSIQCRACHTLEKGGASIIGPNLFGLFGKSAGSAPDFAYSEALAGADFVWTPRALDAWLAEPFRFLPGNRMTFPGLPQQSDRNALIAYLLIQTGQRLPEEESDRG